MIKITLNFPPKKRKHNNLPKPLLFFFFYVHSEIYHYSLNQVQENAVSSIIIV